MGEANQLLEKFNAWIVDAEHAVPPFRLSAANQKKVGRFYDGNGR